jgi:hypothetical protein
MSIKHSSEPAKPASNSKAFTVIIILCFLGIMPILLWVSIPEETGTHTSVTYAEPLVETSAAAAGLQICSSENYPVNVPGGQSAVLYQLSPTCMVQTAETTVQVLVVGFTSSEAQLAAIATAQDTHRNWQTTNTEAFTSGSNVIVIQGAPDNQAVQQIGSSLIEQGAVRII